MNKRVGADILLAVLVAWLVAPVARAYQLVAGRSSDPVAPKDLQVEDFRFKAGADSELAQTTGELAGWTVQTVHGAPAVILVHGFKTSREEMLPWARFLHDALDFERHAKDRILAGEAAVGARVDALVGKVERREETDRLSEIAPGEQRGFLRQGLDLKVGLWLEQRGEFPQGRGRLRGKEHVLGCRHCAFH